MFRIPDAWYGFDCHVLQFNATGRRTEDPNLYGYRTQNSQMPKITPRIANYQGCYELHDSFAAQV